MDTHDLGNTGSVPANELRQVTSLLWQSIEGTLHPAEFSEVRRVLGVSVLEENERLMEEASALTEIIGDVRHAVDTAAHTRLNSKKSLYSNPTRALVEGELRLLIASIKKVTSSDFSRPGSRNGSSHSGSRPNSHQGSRAEINWSDIGAGTASDPLATSIVGTRKYERDDKLLNSAAAAANEKAQALLASTDEERELLKYVTMTTEDLTLRQRSVSSSSRPGSSRPMSSNSRPGSTHSSRELAQFVEKISPQINVFDVNAVAKPLRNLLHLERNALLGDIEYLLQCLEDEALDVRGVGGLDAYSGDTNSLEEQAPPDVATLRQYSGKLRETYETEKQRVEHVENVERLMNVGENGVLGKAGRLASITGGVSKNENELKNEKVASKVPAPPPAPPPTAPKPPTGGRAAAFRRRIG